MKRILFFGKLNDITKDVDNTLMEYFHIQLCELRSDTAEKMLKLVSPDLVIISLVGALEYDKGLFSLIAADYPRIPVITIGTEREKKEFLRFYEDRQFENLTRPVENWDILEAICRRLGMVLSEKDGKYIVTGAVTRKNVLIVDDNPVTLRSIREMLKGDYDVSVATSGIQSMTAIGKRRPDLILLDYEMPVCDGRQTLEMIRADEELKDIPVVFLTGITTKSHVEAVIRLNPQGYLVKPVSREKLLSTIGKHI